MQEEEWSQQGEGDGPDPVHEHPVFHEHAGHDQARQVSGQYGLAPGRGGESAEGEQDNEKEFHLRLTDPVTEPVDHEPCRPRKHQEREDRDGYEHEKHPAVGGEQAPQSQHRAEVRYKAGRQYELAEVTPVQSRLDHHGIDHRDRGGAQGDPAYLGGVQVPAEYELAESECA